MDNEQYYDLDGGKKQTQHKFLGQGAYGCTVTPGIDCKGKTNKYSYRVNKIQEVNFSSKNELEISNAIKKEIKNYKKRFVPINKSCIVKFNQIPDNIVSNCESGDLFSSNPDNPAFIKKEYYMFYMNYIKGDSLQNILLSFKTNNKFYDNFFYSLYYLLNSIYILNKIKIVHNDLHYNNIMSEISTNTPFIIDFGLSYKYKSLFKNSYGFDYSRMRKYFFDWREGMYWHLNEKKFITFIIDNRSNVYQSYVNSDYTENVLTKEIVDIFINDTYYSIYTEADTKILFEKQEYHEYYRVLKNFYYKFLPENDTKGKYKYYSNIIDELLPYVLKFNDLHSVSSCFIQIFYRKISQEIEDNPNANPNNSHDYMNIWDFIKSLIKKVYYPDPYYRLTIHQFISIFSFVFKFCQVIDVKDLKDKKYIDVFFINFKSLLNDIGYSYDLFFNKNYAYVDFHTILEKENIMLIKNFNFTII
mgnify:CR=1 FL=1